MSMTFVAVICDADDLCSVNNAYDPESSFTIVTSEYDSAFVLFKLKLQLRMREIYGRGRDDPMDDLDVNMAIWRIFLNATLQTAVHLEQDDEANLRYVKNHLWSSVKQLVNETGTLILGQTEITGVNKIDLE